MATKREVCFTMPVTVCPYLLQSVAAMYWLQLGSAIFVLTRISTVGTNVKGLDVLTP